MKSVFYKILLSVYRLYLHRKGWVLSDNVVVSIHGVRKIGGGKVYCADNVNINTGCMLVASADIHIGKNSTLAYKSLLTTNANPNAPYSKLAAIYPPIHEDIWIGDNVWIGAGAIILPGIRIGDNSVIAAGSVVCNDIPNNVMAAGVPAKVKKQIDL